MNEDLTPSWRKYENPPIDLSEHEHLEVYFVQLPGRTEWTPIDFSEYARWREAFQESPEKFEGYALKAVKQTNQGK